MKSFLCRISCPLKQITFCIMKLNRSRSNNAVWAILHYILLPCPAAYSLYFLRIISITILQKFSFTSVTTYRNLSVPNTANPQHWPPLLRTQSTNAANPMGIPLSCLKSTFPSIKSSFFIQVALCVAFRMATSHSTKKDACSTIHFHAAMSSVANSPTAIRQATTVSKVLKESHTNK